MATIKQVKYYESLCEQACIEPEDDSAQWTITDMSAAIKELKEIVNGVETDLENDDGLQVVFADDGEIDDDHMPDEAYKGVYKGGND